MIKVVTRHVWEEFKEAVAAHRLTETGKAIYKRRKETVERSFADAKELYGHRYARYRGLAKERARCLLAAACQNMKKIARLLARALRRLRFAMPSLSVVSLRLRQLPHSIGQPLLSRRLPLSSSSTP